MYLLHFVLEKRCVRQAWCCLTHRRKISVSSTQWDILYNVLIKHWSRIRTWCEQISRFRYQNWIGTEKSGTVHHTVDKYKFKHPLTWWRLWWRWCDMVNSSWTATLLNGLQDCFANCQMIMTILHHLIKIFSSYWKKMICFLHFHDN